MNPNDIFKAFNQLSVLVIGDVMIDRYLNGKVDRISPEAPVPVVRLLETENRLGGAANVALNLKALGAEAILCSIIGKDANAEIFQQLLPKSGLKTEGILQSSQRCTTVKTRIIAAHQHLLRVDQEDTFDLSNEEEMNVLNKVGAIIQSHTIDVILLQDYNKGVLSKNVIRKLIHLANLHHIRVAVDPKFYNFLAYDQATLFKPNLKEIREALPFPVEDQLNSLRAASAYLRKQMPHQLTMITLSEKGIYIDDGSVQKIIPTQARDIADVCGAGDTVISVAALGLALQLPLEDIALLSNLAGGQVCEHVGVVSVDKDQLKDEYLELLKYSET